MLHRRNRALKMQLARRDQLCKWQQGGYLSFQPIQATHEERVVEVLLSNSLLSLARTGIRQHLHKCS